MYIEIRVQCSVLCVLMVEGMSVVVNVVLSLMCVMSPPPGSKRHSGLATPVDPSCPQQ